MTQVRPVTNAHRPRQRDSFTSRTRGGDYKDRARSTKGLVALGSRLNADALALTAQCNAFRMSGGASENHFGAGATFFFLAAPGTIGFGCPTLSHVGAPSVGGNSSIRTSFTCTSAMPPL